MIENKIRVAIAGYGNLGKGIESQISKNPDMELVCIFTRRDPSSLQIKSSVPVVNMNDKDKWKDKIDVVFLCGGSATDLPTQGPEFTSSVLIAYGRATYRMWQNGERGCKNFSDVAPKYLSPIDYTDIISQIL